MIDVSAMKLILLESFIAFSAVGIIISVYLQLNPFLFPGLQSKLNWLFILYLLFLASVYYAEIMRYSISGILIPIKHAIFHGIPFSKNIVSTLENAYEQIDIAHKKSTEFESIKIGANNIFQLMLTIFCILLVIKGINTNLIEADILISFMSILIIFGATIMLMYRSDNSNINY